MQETGEEVYHAEQATHSKSHAEPKIFIAAALNKGAIDKKSQQKITNVAHANPDYAKAFIFNLRTWTIRIIKPWRKLNELATIIGKSINEIP